MCCVCEHRLLFGSNRTCTPGCAWPDNVQRPRGLQMVNWLQLRSSCAHKCMELESPLELVSLCVLRFYCSQTVAINAGLTLQNARKKTKVHSLLKICLQRYYIWRNCNDTLVELTRYLVELPDLLPNWHFRLQTGWPFGRDASKFDTFWLLHEAAHTEMCSRPSWLAIWQGIQRCPPEAPGKRKRWVLFGCKRGRN